MAEKKIAKRQGQIIGETPDSIARAIFDLENNVPELKKDLKPLQITDAKEVFVGVGFFFTYLWLKNLFYFSGIH